MVAQLVTDGYLVAILIDALVWMALACVVIAVQLRRHPREIAVTGRDVHDSSASLHGLR